MTVLFLKPVFQERIWGGSVLQEWFPHEKLTSNIGECWAISAHPNGISQIENGQYAGMTLKELYEQQPEIFGNPKEKVFPLLVKILDASDDLSVQVHPDDTYGLRVEGELGKTECWYVLDAKDDAKIIYGHTAKTQAEFSELVAAGAWGQLLKKEPVKKGDFFYVPSGTIHALCAGTVVLEVQQSSDTTYRLYDYDRLDDQGNKRELHIDKALDVTTIPHVNPSLYFAEDTYVGATYLQLVQNDFFTVAKLSITSEHLFTRSAAYVLATVISGNGSVDGVPIAKGTSFIIPNTVNQVKFLGELDIIISYV